MSTGRTFVLRSQVCFVTWNRSHIQDHEEFYSLVKLQLPPKTQLYGSKELHKDGVPHYHVVIRFPYRVHWTDARRQLMLILDDGSVDTQSIRIELPQAGESEHEFIQRTQAYCSKDNNMLTFGDWISMMRSCTDCQKVLSHDTEAVCVTCVEGNYINKVCEYWMLRYVNVIL
jgi:hypothetical protein